MSNPRPSIRLLRWCLLPPLLALLASAAAAAAPAHDLYICANPAGRGTVMGSKLKLLAGLYRMADRETPQHIGFNHVRIETLAWDPRDLRRWYLPGLNGVLRTADAGASWRIVTSWDMTEPKDIAVDPNAPDHLYAGIPDGIAVSLNGGDTWQRMDKGIARKYTRSVAVDRTKAGRVLAGTEKGVYLTEDGAKTWTLVLPAEATVNDVRQSPHDPKVFLAVTERNGVHESRDGGRTWRAFAGIPSGQTFHHGDYDSQDPRRIVVCGWVSGILLTEDGGKTWSHRSEGLPSQHVMRVAFDPDFPRRLYANTYEGPVYVSDDLGATWTAKWFESAVVFDFVFLPRR